MFICAPAGYGKTSVLVQAHEQLIGSGLHAAWVSLDEGDKDLSRFAAYLARAISHCGVSLGQPANAWIGAEVSPAPEALRTTILNELALLRDDLFLLLDDYHLVSDPEIKALVNALLLSPAQQLRLLVASRTHNDLPLARLRALGLVEEIEVADLTFSEPEVGEFVARVRGAPLSAAQVTRLRDVTEGWAASLQMASIALRDVADVDRFLDRFSGENSTIGDFLGDEVLRQQPVDLQEFMTVSALLERLNWSLCNAVTGATDGRAMIEALEQRNLFLFSIDPERKWFRYHPLFADFLRRRCADRYPDRIRNCHLRASAWLADHGFMVEAIEHAFKSGDDDRAGRLLDRASGDLFAAGQTGTLMALSARLPHAVLARLPHLQLERAWYSQLSWNFADARIALAHVRAVLEDGTSLGGVSARERALLESRLAHRDMMLSVLSDDMHEGARRARDWLARDTSQDAFMAASTGTAIMAAQRVMFQCEGTLTSARMLHARYVEGGARYGLVFHQCVVGNVLFERGDLDLAHDSYERALQVAVELQGEHSALYNMPALMSGELHYERNQLLRCEEVLAQRDIGTRLGFVDNLIAGYATRGRLHARRGRLDEAAELVREGLWLAAQYAFTRMEAALRHEQAWLVGEESGRAGDTWPARRIGSPAVGTAAASAPRDGVTMTELLVALTSARASLASGQPRDAIPLLRSWLTFTRDRRCHRAATRCGALLTRVLLAAGDRRSALRTLTDALALAAPGGFIRTFVDEGPEVAALVAEIAEQCAHPPANTHATLVRRAFENPDDSTSVPGIPDSAHPDAQDVLTTREIQILELGARGMQNADIAQATFLAQSTVKWYWQRIFEKLAVRRRPDAIRRARENHWIR